MTADAPLTDQQRSPYLDWVRRHPDFLGDYRRTGVEPDPYQEKFRVPWDAQNHATPLELARTAL
jgi:hypothetical protein